MDIKQFFNAELKTRKVFVSDRFVSEDGAKVPFTIRAITELENEEIKEQCERFLGDTKTFDDNLYKTKLICKCVVEPDLNSSELQSKYRVLGAEKLIKTMLYVGEYDNLSYYVRKICGFDASLEDKISKLKN